MILLDIEGTTTPIAFVTETLFPYARTHLAPFLRRHAADPGVQDAIARLEQEHARERGEAPPWSVDGYARWLMDRDRKSPALKDLQGRIWEEGYASGALTGQVFDDVPGAFARWRDAGTPIAIYSSGSVLAQQWLFRRSTAGDLTPFVAAYFDTAVGPKREAASYTRIANNAGAAASSITFVSDITAELDAARAAGMAAVLIVRPGNPPQPPHDHRVVATLDDV